MIVGSNPRVGALWWGTLALFVLGLQVAGVRSGRVLSLGQFLGPLLRRRWIRVLAVSAWLYAGWHVFVH